MKNFVLSSLLGLVAFGGLAAAYPLANTNAERSDCPGKVVCPLTGEEVCKDRCPVSNVTTSAETTPAASEEEVELPPCCQDKM